MSKATKNDMSSGGDERETTERKNKTTGTPTKSTSNASLVKKVGKSQSSIRTKSSGGTVTRQSTSNTIRALNRQSIVLRTPIKTGLGQPTNRVNRLGTTTITTTSTIAATNKEAKSEGVKTKSQTIKMKQEIENAELQQKFSNIQSENQEASEQIESIKQQNESNDSDEQPPEELQNGVNGKDVSPDEIVTENGTNENGKSEHHDGNIPTNEKEEEFNLRLEAEDQNNKSENTTKDISENNREEDVKNESKASSEEIQENSQPDTEICSVDVVESTTSELSEATESSAPSEVKDRDIDAQEANNDGVSYNTSITLKDVKIELNDCLKDPQAEESPVTGQDQLQETSMKISYADYVRSRSKRRSISRCRNINDSLFVNTSNMSTSEDGPSNHTMNHGSFLSEAASSNNGNNSYLLSRKRKLAESTSSDEKKPKTDISFEQSSQQRPSESPRSPRPKECNNLDDSSNSHRSILSRRHCVIL